VCDPATGTCDYGPYPNGTRICEGLGVEPKPCCPGQICAFPSNCGSFCLTKYCYYPGAPMP
jgi:hypothetical protein